MAYAAIGDSEIADLSAAINSLTKAMKSKAEVFEEDADRIEHKSKPLFSSYTSRLPLLSKKLWRVRTSIR